MHRWWIAAGGLLSLALLGAWQGADPSTNPTFTIDPLNQVAPEPPEQAVPSPQGIIDPVLQPVIDYVLQDMTAQGLIPLGTSFPHSNGLSPALCSLS